MVEPVAILGLLAAAGMGWAIGADSVAPALAPLNAIRAVTLFRAALLTGVFGFLGGVLQGGGITEAVGTAFLRGGTFSGVEGAIILVVAAALIVYGTIRDVPLPTAFTVVGAIVGAALASTLGLNTGKVVQVVGFWLLVPPVAALLGYTVSRLLRRYVPRENRSAIAAILLAVSAYTAFTAGAHGVALSVGPVLGAAPLAFDNLLLFGSAAILIGAWTGAPRIINAVSREYAGMGPRRAIAALTSAAVLAQVGIWYGIPVSFNEAIIAAIIGSGLAAGRDHIGVAKLRTTAAWWVASFVGAVLLAYAAVTLSAML